MKYILILTLITGGVSNTNVEFNNLEACQKAKELWIKNATADYVLSNAICVPKG